MTTKLFFGTNQEFLYSVIVIVLFLLGDIMKDCRETFKEENIQTIDTLSFLVIICHITIWDNNIGIIPGVVIGYFMIMSILKAKDIVAQGGFLLATGAIISWIIL